MSSYFSRNCGIEVTLESQKVVFMYLVGPTQKAYILRYLTTAHEYMSDRKLPQKTSGASKAVY